MTAPDLWTSTVDGAAGHARQHGEEPYPTDRPDPAELAELDEYLRRTMREMERAPDE